MFATEAYAEKLRRAVPSSMFAEANVTHMIAICNNWARDELACSLWNAEDAARLFTWCKAKRGRIPNLDRKTSGGGSLYKLVQILDQSCTDETMLQKRSCALTKQHVKEDQRAWIAPLAFAVLQLALEEHARREEADDEFFDD